MCDFKGNEVYFPILKTPEFETQKMFQWDQPGIDTCIPSWPSLPGWQECWATVPSPRSSPCVAATCHLSGHVLVRWNKLWLRTLQEYPQHSDIHWHTAAANSCLRPPHKASTIKGKMLPHISWLLSANFHQQISTTTSPQRVQCKVCPS